MATSSVGEVITNTKALKLKAKAKNKKSLNSVKALTGNIKRKLNDKTSENDNFYYKVAWNLSEATIYGIIERSERARNPLRYFMFSAGQELRQ